MLAGELALSKVDVVIVERRATQELEGARAGGLHSRTIELLDQRGIADRFLSEGKVMQVAGFAMIPLDISDFPLRRNHGLALFQNHIERILAAWVEELGVPIFRSREVTGFSQDDSGVDVQLSDGSSLEAEFLVGCDGGRSVIRKLTGIEFPGWDPTVSYLIAEADMTGEPAFGVRYGARGVHGIGKHEDGKRVRVVMGEPEVNRSEAPPTLDELRAALTAVYGTDYGVHNVTFLSRFTDMTRQAASYRQGRVLLAGDAAHIHSPAGGQGLNMGVQDAVNLGWKLAQVVKGTSPDGLLDSYQAERHPIAARVLELTMAQTALARGDERTRAAHKLMGELLKLDEPRTRYGAMMSGLDIHYDLGEGHPLLGRRMPDLELVTESGTRRVFDFLHAVRPVLLVLGQSGLDIAPWADRVQRVEATYAGAWELPVLGAAAAPSAVLIRPDGHVAWVGEGTDQGLTDALTKWFGPPSAAS
jgi:2-polyprenyl-6-methoxyphenol hydroxylase-like FAD-dependent oxidoreductase